MIIGLDVSTSVVGISYFYDNGIFVNSTYIDLRKIDDFYDKCLKFKTEFISSLNDLKELNYIFVEDKLGGFSMGKTTSQTIMKLAAFNSTVSYILFQLTNIRPIHIHPSTIKSSMKNEGLIIPTGVKGQDKKKFVLNWVSKKEASLKLELTKNGTPKPYMFDQADSYCIAYTGYRKFVCEEKKK